MRHRDDRARIALEKLLQPLYRQRIEMVGRLIEQQHVGLREQQPAQRYAPSFATGKLGHIGIPGRQPQRVGGDIESPLDLPAVDRVDLVLQLALLFEQLVHLVFVERLGELVADLVEALDERNGVGDAFLDVAAHVLIFIEMRLLRQEAHAHARLRDGFAVELPVDARHDLEQARFARAVEPEHADLGAGKEVEGDVLEDRALRRDDLGDAPHRVGVLSHARKGSRGNR